MEEKEYYNLRELKELYGISVRTWREYIKFKHLKAAKIGRSYFVARDDVIGFFKTKAIVRFR